MGAVARFRLGRSVQCGLDRSTSIRYLVGGTTGVSGKILGVSKKLGYPRINRLSDRGVKAFISKARAGYAETTKLSDGGGLYLMLTRRGLRLADQFSIGGKEKVYAAGVYPTSPSRRHARSEPG